jgi:hypothetical protein
LKRSFLKMTFLLGIWMDCDLCATV